MERGKDVKGGMVGAERVCVEGEGKAGQLEKRERPAGRQAPKWWIAGRGEQARLKEESMWKAQRGHFREWPSGSG